MQQRALDMSRKVKVRCVRADVADYPLVPVSIKFRGKTHRMEVAVNSHLKHPLILGTDWPAFTQLLGIVCADSVCGRSGRGSASGPVTACLGGNESRRGGETSWAGWLPSGAVAGWGAQKRVWPGPLGGRAASPAERPPLLPLLCPYKREVVSGNPRCPVKGGDNPIISSQKPPGNDFPGGALYSHGRPLGGGKDTRTHYGPILLAGHSRERPPVVCGVSRMSAGESAGHSQSALTAKAPLRPLPLMEVPFERIGMDLIGPLERSARGHRFALVLVDYATRYP